MSRHAGRIFAADGDNAIRFAQVNKAANKLGNSLARRGAKKGAIVASMMKNSVEAVIIRIAAYKAGWVFCGLIDDFSPQAVLEMLGEVGATVLFVDAANLSRVDFAELMQHTKIKLVISTVEAKGAVRLADLLSEGESEEPEVEIAPDDVAAIGFTSGTTGRSKGVVWTQAAWMQSFYNMLCNRQQVVRADDVFLHVIPFSTAGSLVLLPCLAGGMRNVYLSEFNPRDVCELIQKHHVTRLFLAPVFLVDLWDFYVAGGRKYDLGSLQSINVGSEPMYAAKYQVIQKDLGVMLDHGYGMAEVLAPLTTHRTDCDTVQPGNQLSVGHVADGVEIRVVDADEAGRGRLAIKSKSRASGYWCRSELTAQHFVGDQFLTNDIGYFDGDGCLYLLDRKDDVIERGGCKVFPRIIEERLHTCAAVKDAAVIEKEGKIVAYVTARRGHRIDVGALQATCERWLLRHERPDTFVVVGNFPISTSGKVLKRKLADLKGRLA